MADTAKFEISLDDGVSGPAKTAKSALGDLRAQLDRSRSELASMNRAMREMKAGGDTASAGFVELKAKIEAQKASVAAATAKYVELGGTFRKVSKEAGDAAGEVKKSGTVMESLVNRAGSGAPTIARFAAEIGLIGPIGLVAAAGVAAIVAAMAAVTIATLAAGAALAVYGIRAADARRSEGLRLEGLTRLRRGMGQTAGVASEMQSAIDRVSDSSSASRGTLEGYASRLHRLGLRGGNFTAALEGMAIRGEVLGDRYAQSFAGMAAAAARSGRSVRALADDVKARLGDLASQKLQALDVQTRKWGENMDALFRNVKIGGFLKVMQAVVQAFSQSSVTGRAMAGILERMFEPFNAGANRSVGTMRRFMEKLVFHALGIELAWENMKNGVLTAITYMNDRGILLGVVWQKLGDTANLLGDILKAPLVLAGQIGERITKVWRNFDMRSIARNLINGLVIGIATGTVQVVQAVTTMAAATTGALREALQIKSPSRVFAGLGREIPRGLAVGIDAGTEAAEASVANMIDVSTGDVNGGGGAVASQQRPSVIIQSITVQTAATDAAGIAQDLGAWLASTIEGLAIMRGEPT
jgi:hypothetical protein